MVENAQTFFLQLLFSFHQRLEFYQIGLDELVNTLHRFESG